MTVQYLIGTDEAGFGPNLGPLVISATLWQVPTGIDGRELYRRLADVIVSTPKQIAESHETRVAMGDSKVLYKSGGGLRHLERGLWAALATLDRRPQTWHDAWEILAAEAVASMKALPWYADYDARLPRDADPHELQLLGPALHEGLAAADVRLTAMRSRAIFPGEFNALIERHGSKGALLSHATLSLAGELVQALDEGPISVICDKHGGRNRYGELLSEHFPGPLIEVYGEGRQRSAYRFGPPQRRVEFCFQMQAESYLPAALASMASKYLRELAMQALNEFWCARVDNLKPTAGYPQDAKRFKTAIAAVQAELEIEDRLLWRSR